MRLMWGWQRGDDDYLSEPEHYKDEPELDPRRASPPQRATRVAQTPPPSQSKPVVISPSTTHTTLEGCVGLYPLYHTVHAQPDFGPQPRPQPQPQPQPGSGFRSQVSCTALDNQLGRTGWQLHLAQLETD